MNSAQWPKIDQRKVVEWVSSPHPATLDTEKLAARVETRFQRRGGPGGQHRNKVSTGAFVQDRPTGVVAEATESRSQKTNRSEAMLRLRISLALAVRTISPLNQNVPTVSGPVPATIDEYEIVVRRRIQSTGLRLAVNNPDRPAAIALVLNDLYIAGGQPSLIVESWKVSTSRLVAFLKATPPAMIWVNGLRTHHGRLPLK